MGRLGIDFDATASAPTTSPGQQVKVRLEAINRSALDVQLNALSIRPSSKDTTTAFALINNKGFILNTSITIPENAPYTAPYWLQKAATIGMYNVEDQLLRGVPETPGVMRLCGC